MRATARKLLRVVPESVQGFYADHCPLQAAGIAYRVLFSIVPLAIVLVSIFGLVLQDDEIRANVVNAIVDFLPVSSAGRNDVEKALSSIATPASAAGLVSLLVFGWAATGMMSSIRQGLETAMHVVYTRPTARGKLVDVLLVVGTGALVLLHRARDALGGIVEKYATPSGRRRRAAPWPTSGRRASPSRSSSRSCCSSTGSSRPAGSASGTGSPVRS